MDQSFRDEMTAGYALTEPAVVIGSPMLEGEVDNDARVQVALSMLNRHGLIAGATGTGKTKTLQLLAGPAVEGRGAGLHQPTSRATCRAWPRRATRPTPRSRSGRRR